MLAGICREPGRLATCTVDLMSAHNLCFDVGDMHLGIPLSVALPEALLIELPVLTTGLKFAELHDCTSTTIGIRIQPNMGHL